MAEYPAVARRMAKLLRFILVPRNLRDIRQRGIRLAVDNFVL
jgi:hypothetical protein